MKSQFAQRIIKRIRDSIAEGAENDYDMADYALLLGALGMIIFSGWSVLLLLLPVALFWPVKRRR